MPDNDEPKGTMTAPITPPGKCRPGPKVATGMTALRARLNLTELATPAAVAAAALLLIQQLESDPPKVFK